MKLQVWQKVPLMSKAAGMQKHSPEWKVENQEATGIVVPGGEKAYHHGPSPALVGSTKPPDRGSLSRGQEHAAGPRRFTSNDTGADL